MALKKYRKQNEERGIIPETEKNKDSEIQRSFNHAYYQGLLVIIGNLRNLKKRLFQNQDKIKNFTMGKRFKNSLHSKKITQLLLPRINKSKCDD